MDVLTQNYDNYRSGANLQEKLLNTHNVAPATFGRLYSYNVDGPVFSQPLIATGVDMPDHKPRDVLYVTTASNSVYAFDAHRQEVLWRRGLTQLPDGPQAMAGGILSTPVIDRTSGTLYVVAMLSESTHNRFVLHALQLADGQDRRGSPVLVQGSVRVDSSQVNFEPTITRIGVQRAALAIVGDRLIVAFGGDYFEGWVFSFNLRDLQETPNTFCTTCASHVRDISGIDYLDSKCTLLGPGGGIWQSGRGPVVDDKGTLYFFTGNKQHVIRDGCPMRYSRNACSACAQAEGCVCKGNRSAGACRGHDACEANHSADGHHFDTHDALIALSTNLDLLGWFRPENWNASGVNGLEYNDLDLGGSGPLLIPGTSRLIGGGKQGVMYTLDVIRTSEDCVATFANECINRQPLQSFQVAPSPLKPNEYYRHILGGPVLWSRSIESGGTRAYLWRENDVLRSYALTDQFENCANTTATPTTTHTCEPAAKGEDYIDHHPGGILTLSANGSDAASGIVWVSKHQSNSGPASLMAFKALPDSGTTKTLEKLWDSSLCEGDALEAGSEFMPPTVANGKVYLATHAGSVEVFGLLPSRECLPQPLRPMMSPFLQ